MTHYVGKAIERLDLSKLAAVGLDETAAKRGQNYVTVFIDIDRSDKPVVFVTPGSGKETVAKFNSTSTPRLKKPCNLKWVRATARLLAPQRGSERNEADGQE